MNFLKKILKWWKERKDNKFLRKYKPFYRYVEVESWKSTQPIEIIEGEYKGTVYLYGPIRFLPDGSATFSCEIISGRTECTEDPSFQELARNILICAYMEGVRTNPWDEYEDRTCYSEEPFVQRSVRKKDSSILEE